MVVFVAFCLVLGGKEQQDASRSYLLKRQFEAGTTLLYHHDLDEQIHILSPKVINRQNEYVSDESQEVLKLTESGNAIIRNTRKYVGVAKPVVEYQVIDVTGRTISRGPDLNSQEPMTDADWSLPFPEDPVSIGESWTGKFRFGKFATFDERCTLKRVEWRYGDLFAWITFSSSGSQPEAKLGLTLTKFEMHGQYIFDISKGNLVRFEKDIQAEDTVNQKLWDNIIERNDTRFELKETGYSK